MSAQRARTLPAVRVGLALLVALLGAAACGGVHYPGDAAKRTLAPAAQAAMRAKRLGPPGATRAQADALARLMLERMVLPAGARRERARPLPRSLRQPGQIMGATRFADLVRLYRLPLPTAEATAFLHAHTPAGMAVSDTSIGGGPGVASMQTIADSPRRLPPGIYAAELIYTVVPASNGVDALLRVDSQAIWYPSRSVTEYIDPAAFRSVRIWVALTPGHALWRTVTSRTVISALATLINSLHAFPPGSVLSCPLFGGFALRFNAADSHDDVAMSSGGCPFAAVTVGSATQPELYDPGAEVAILAHRLLRTTQAGTGTGRAQADHTPAPSQSPSAVATSASRGRG